MTYLREICVFIGVLNIIVSIIGLEQIIDYSFQFAEYYDQKFDGLYSKLIVPIISVIFIKQLVASFLLAKGALAIKFEYFIFWLGFNGFLLCLCTFSLLSAFIFILGPVKDVSYFYAVAAVIVLYWIKWITVFSCYENMKKNCETEKINYETHYFRFGNEEADDIVYS